VTTIAENSQVPLAPNDRSAGAEAFDVEAAVRERYSKAARSAEPALCCAVEYDTRYLEIVPDEIVERDYGCGDPSKYVRPGETVLDLGSGGGKICYIAAQIVGPTGRVIGIDCNAEMLALARRHREAVGNVLGYHNVEFRTGRIQDLALDLDLLERHLAEHPVATGADWLAAQTTADRLRAEQPLIADESVDVIVSNCVLNLVREGDRRQLFAEMHRVLKRGGRAVISDIVCDEEVPASLQRDATLWSGCLTGAHREDRFLEAFERAGFYGIEIVDRQAEPWAVVEGIEFRSLTVRAWKGKEGPCDDGHQAVVYNGPWRAVIDDDGHRLDRGRRMAVCEKTFAIYTREPYVASITPLPPHEPVAPGRAKPFDCHAGEYRDPRITKGRTSEGLTVLPAEEGCTDEACC
jgi:arsenite methyltransferase